MMIISGEVVKVKRHVDFVNSETADCVSEIHQIFSSKVHRFGSLTTPGKFNMVVSKKTW